MPLSSLLIAGSANAQEKKSTATKLNSVGAAIEFSGGGTSFGIKAKIANPGVPLSFRPMVLFGHTPDVSGVDFSKAVLNGSGNLSNFATLTPEEKRAQVKLFTDLNLNDQQADDVAKRTSEALTVLPANRTAEQNILANAIGDGDAFSASTPAEKRAAVKTAYNVTLTDAQADAIADNLSSALSKPVATQTQAEKDALATAKTYVSFVARTEAIGFTPGSGVAYGAAVTYDFESADKKLSGYIGPRVLFASGAGKTGNFDTITNETNIGLLVGADYEISPDFTAGLSGTYNFSKTGSLDISGPGGFKGSSSVSGGSFDVGINFAYRF